MQYRDEIRQSALAAAKGKLTGTEFRHADPDTHVETIWRIGTITDDRYGTEPCLIAQCETDNEEDGTIELVIQIGMLEI